MLLHPPPPYSPESVKEYSCYRVSELVSRLQEVEKDREHWKLEHQLSQIKLDKQHQGDQVSLLGFAACVVHHHYPHGAHGV